MRRLWQSPAGLALWLSVVAACSTSGTGDARAEAAPQVASVDELAKKGAKGVLEAYENVRRALAEDRIADALKRAQALGQVALSVQVEGAPDTAKALARAAQAMAGEPAAEPDAVRKAFGEVSRNMLALVNAVPDLKQGLHLFECPMAQGYKRWLQPGAKMANPYMGKRMLECGVERTL